MSRPHYHFITGRLAEHALRSVVAPLAERVGFDYSLDILPITVAALMTTDWVARKMRPVPAEATSVLLPGYCTGDVAPIAARAGKTVEVGPRDLRALPEYFGQSGPPADYGAYSIEILAEINHAPRMLLSEILRQADELRRDGADLIDVGCDPGEPWAGVGECVRALRDAGHRVSIDSFNPVEIAQAVRAGAELVLSVNATNRDAAPDWGCEVVVVPDDFPTLGGLEETIDQLAAACVRLRIDPVLEPIGCGFAASVGRNLEVRRRYPDAEMMMGIGNLTELTDTDSAGINVLLLGICEELGIRSVLTTQVINWARTSVRECDLARRLVHFAVRQGVPPKRVEPRLVSLRDPRVHEFGPDELARLGAEIKDTNYRLFAEGGLLHWLGGGLHLQGTDPFVLFEQMLAARSKELEPGHAFYLGYEMCKAVTALTLGKEYRQDEALNWGYLTREEESHKARKKDVKEQGEGSREQGQDQ